MKDFKDELPCYLLNRKISELLTNLSLKAGPEFLLENLQHCYEELVRAEIFPHPELDFVEAWSDDIRAIFKEPSNDRLFNT